MLLLDLYEYQLSYISFFTPAHKSGGRVEAFFANFATSK